MIFSASYGTWAKISTTIIVVLFFTLGGIEIWDDEPASGFMSVMPFALILVVAFAYLFSVKNYEVTDRELIIHKPFGKTIYPRNEIETVQQIDRRLLRFAIRTFGIGGVFGYYGEFYTGKLGSMTWYRTQLSNPVMIRTAKKKIVFSPDDPEKLIAALQP